VLHPWLFSGVQRLNCYFEFRYYMRIVSHIVLLNEILLAFSRVFCYYISMINRTVWIEKIERLWRERNVIWLSGIRRSGKTCLCRTLENVEYFDCELPSVRRMLEDVESFWRRLNGRNVVLDEVHRLANPSEVLKIAADHYPDTHIIATGSSTLGASSKFRDTLAGRKRNMWLTPMILEDNGRFGNPELEHRMLCGGLPPFFLSPEIPERDFQEWIDSFWAKDILELFRLEKRASFQRLIELLLIQSGGIFEATRFAAECEVDRSTISNYLKVLEATFVMHVIRPYSTRKPTEIVSAPKVYGFDTGFVCYYKGIQALRHDDLGYLWEHIVLNEMFAAFQHRNVRYWRDKSGHEVDFVIKPRGGNPVAIECKWSSKSFDAAGLKAFRRRYPDGKNYVVCRDVEQNYYKTFGAAKVEFIALPDLVRALATVRL